MRDQPAGLRTHALVCVGAAMFGIISVYGFLGYSPPSDPSRVAAQVVTGIGFLGAGAILRLGATVRGLTTAASLWIAAGVGLAAGIGMYFASAVGTAVTLILLLGVRIARDPLRRVFGQGRYGVIIELERRADLSEVLRLLSSPPMYLVHVDVDEEAPSGIQVITAVVRLEHGQGAEVIVPIITKVDGVRTVDVTL